MRRGRNSVANGVRRGPLGLLVPPTRRQRLGRGGPKRGQREARRPTARTPDLPRARDPSPDSPRSANPEVLGNRTAYLTARNLEQDGEVEAYLVQSTDTVEH